MEVLDIKPSGEVATVRFLGLDGSGGPSEEIEGLSVRVRPVGLEQDSYWREAGKLDVHVLEVDPEVSTGRVVVFEDLSVSLAPEPERDQLFAVQLTASTTRLATREPPA
jgi:hypothetical protein